MEMGEAYTMVMSLFLLVLGFVLLVKGADYFVDGASDIARRFGIPKLLIGLTKINTESFLSRKGFLLL